MHLVLGGGPDGRLRGLDLVLIRAGPLLLLELPLGLQHLLLLPGSLEPLLVDLSRGERKKKQKNEILRSTK